MTRVGSPLPNCNAWRRKRRGTSETGKEISREINYVFDVVNVADVAHCLIDDLMQIAPDRL